MAKITDALEKNRNDRPTASTPPKLKKEDWAALLKYSKRTGKLRTHSSKIIKDPGTLHRLLANKLILPDGRLTRAAILKCEKLSHHMRTSLAGPAEDPVDPEKEQVDPEREQVDPEREQAESSIPSPQIEMSDSDWAILMTYDRQTGHLLKYDHKTGQLDKGSMEILRDTGTVQRLLKKKMIYPGGELTPLARQVCKRRERKLQKETPEKKPVESIRDKKIPEPEPRIALEKNKAVERQPASGPKFLIPAEEIPAVEANDVQRKKDRSLETASIKHKTRAVDKNLVSLLDPQRFESEQFKILRTNIFFPVSGKAPRSVLVTSVAPSDGKSFVSSNLAISVANAIDRHVLLIDCDLRKPTIQGLFGLGRVAGLADYLINETPLPSLLVKTKVDKLTILPAGSPPHNPAELLSSERMANLVKEVSERYSDRFIIIDSPPPKLTAETFVLASQVDGVVLVVKYGSTPRDMVAELIQKIGKKKILGCVLNYFDVRTPGYRYRYYGRYYGTYTLKRKSVKV